MPLFPLALFHFPGAEERVKSAMMADPDDRLLPLSALSAYAGLSVRTLRMYLDLPPAEALPCYRVGGKILVRRSAFDDWLEQFRSRGRPSLALALKQMGLDGA